MTTVLVCECGLRIRAPGARPGRTGRCPSCGAALRVPEVEPEPVPAPRPTAAEPAAGLGYALGADTSTATPSREARRRRSPEPAEAPALDLLDRGLVRRPASVERRVGDCLAYPLWDAQGLAFLAFYPAALAFATLLSFGLAPSFILGDDEVPKLGSMTMAFPMACLLAMGCGSALRFIDESLAAGASGEVRHPRVPSWSLPDAFGRLIRLGIVLAAALLVSGPLAWAYARIRPWPPRPADAAVFALCALPGLLYAAIAYLAAVLHDDPLAANPVTVLGGLFRGGWAALRLGLAAALAVAIPAALGLLLFRAAFLVAVLGTYLLWLVLLYQALVASRILALLYRRRARPLDWFPERTRWGAK